MKKYFPLILFLVSVHLFAAAQSNAGNQYFTVKHFNLLRDHITKKGKVAKVDVSGNGNGKWIVTYHTIKDHNWTVTIDKTKRIYFSFIKDGADEHFGNVMLEDGKVITEITYGLGREQTPSEIIEDNRKAKILTEEYNKLIEKILDVAK